MPVVFYLIISLLGLELVSRILSSGPRAKLAQRIKDLGKHVWDIAALLVWLIFSAICLLYSLEASSLSYTLLTIGAAFFVLGWFVRYEPSVVDFLVKRFKYVRPLQRPRFRFWRSLELSPLHAKFYAPCFQIIGLSLICVPFPSFLSVLAFPLIMGISVMNKVRPPPGSDGGRPSPSLSNILPRVRHVMVFAVVPVAIGVIVGVGTREFAIFYGDTQTARTLLFSLSQIEGSVGILAITVAFVLTQLTTANYSIRASRVFFRQPALLIALLILVTSVSYNLVVAARSARILPQNETYYANLTMDVSLALALAAACGVGYFIFSATRMVSPEFVISDSLRGFDKEWLQMVRQNWRRPTLETVLRPSQDPFMVIGRVLSRAVESGDNVTFVSGLVLIREHLYELTAAQSPKLEDCIIEIDAYFRYHFRSLVRVAARNADNYTLLHLLYFTEELGAPSEKAILECRPFAFGFDGAPGELLLREIVEQSGQNGLSECATRGIHEVGERGANAVKALPKETDTWRYNGAKPMVDQSKEERDRLWGNDHRVDEFETQYFSYLRSVGVTAAELKSAEVVRSSTMSLCSLLSAVAKDVDGHDMKAMMVMQGVGALKDVSKASLANRLSNTASLDMMRFVVEQTDSERDERLVWYIVYYASEHLVMSAKLGLLEFGEVIDFAMCGIAVAAKYADPAIHMLRSLGEVAALVKGTADYASKREVQWVYQEAVQRIRQIGHNVPRKDPERLVVALKEVLAALGEPEFSSKTI